MTFMIEGPKAPSGPTSASINVTTSVMVPFTTITVEPWRQVRDYVVGEILRYHGRFPRNAAKESGVFKGFVNRWGDQAMPIAKVAFEVHQGMWHNAPIRVERFSAGSDPYFAAVIAQTL